MNKPYSGRIYENAPADTSVLTVSACDRIDGRCTGQVNYHLTTDTENRNTFDIGKTDGLIRTNGRISKEIGHVFNLFAVASAAPGVTQYEAVTVVVSVYNQYHPSFTQTLFYGVVFRGAPVGSYVTRVTAYDRDTVPYNANITYNLKGDTSMFHVNGSTGIVTSRSTLPSSGTAVNLTVMAEDGGSPRRSDMAQLYIRITDVSGLFSSFQFISRYFQPDENTEYKFLWT